MPFGNNDQGDLAQWEQAVGRPPTAAATATRADRGGPRRATAREASRSETPTNGAELREQSLKIGALPVYASGVRETATGAPLLTVCSQMVRILLDAAAHVRGRHAGQTHIDGRVRTSWDRLAGFKSRHPGPHSLLRARIPGTTRSVRCLPMAIRRPPGPPRRCRSHSARCRRAGAAPPRLWSRQAPRGHRRARSPSATRC
jgi:hypothetical protein